MKSDRNLEVLDKLIADLAEQPASQCELLREHLDTARSFLLGAMPDEYRLNLRLAEEVLNCLTDQNLRSRMEDFIHGQLHPAPVSSR